MLPHIWDSGMSDDYPNAAWRIKQLLYPPFQPDNPPILTLNDLFDYFKASAKECKSQH